ncbi:S8 family serine peptidase [Nitriliruptoraceae bacterium ZYF776]|nr:S8 family serine peptidase [Profundirhabdus halotolerans]
MRQAGSSAHDEGRTARGTGEVAADGAAVTSPRWRAGVARLLLLGLFATLLVPLTSVRPAEAAAFSLTIVVDADGPSLTTGVLRSGGTVVWQNRSGDDLEVTGAHRLIDSGPIPDGGSFHVTVDQPGTYPWETALGGGSFQVELRLTGSNDSPVNLNLPHVPFPDRPEGDLAVHPTLALPTSKSRAVVRWADSTTVQEARSSLSHAQVDIVGALPQLGLAMVSVGEQDDHRSIDWAIDRLRVRPGVEAVIPDLEPEPTALPPVSPLAEDHEVTWTPLTTAPTGHGANWGLELSRVPAAWNLADAHGARGAAPGRTVVIDSGFSAHHDLPRMTIESWCEPRHRVGPIELGERCLSTEPDDHGNHVAGIIGAGHHEDGRPAGVHGVDPTSRVHAVHRKGLGNTEAVLDRLLTELREGRLPDTRVVSVSLALSVRPDRWLAAFQDERCGPGWDDDDDPTVATLPCHPNIEDGRRELAENWGVVYRQIIGRFVAELDDPPLFVFGAGNDGAWFCPEGLTATCDRPEPVAAELVSLGGVASRDWDEAADGPNPILNVEALGAMPASFSEHSPDERTPGTHRAFYSNVGGDLSAPGYALNTHSIVRPADDDPDFRCPGPEGYCWMQGTSMATPFVSGVAGLLAHWAPDLGAGGVRAHLLRWTVADTTDAASPRVDAYLALTALPGVASAIADLSDPSEDGNRRVVRDDDGLPTGLDEVRSTTDGAFSEPDGEVDMRDFRRWRDAWLDRCRISPEAGCPSAVALDGPLDHPKRDLNGDGCIQHAAPAVDQPCPSEVTWSRFDLNGNGTISVNDRALVGLTADGAPAATPDEATEMTDLEFLASQWDGSEGVRADDLQDLLHSADLELHLDGLERSGADNALLEVFTEGGELFSGRLAPLGDGPIIATVPSGEPVTVAVLADGPDDTVATVTEPLTLLAGEDRSLDVCSGVGLVADPTSLRANGSTTELTATVRTCGADPSGIEVFFDLDPVVADGARLPDVPTAVTDANGQATITVDGGTVQGTYTVTAVADVPDADGDTRARQGQTAVLVGDRYDLEVLATDGAGSGYQSLLWAALDGPSINALGQVAFGARRAGGTHDTVLLADPDVQTIEPHDPTTVTDLGHGGLEAGDELDASPQLNDVGEVVAGFESFDDATLVLRSAIRLLDAVAPGTVETLFEAVDALGGGGGSTPEARRVELPTINNVGDVLFRANPDGTTGGHVLARPDGEGGLVTGPDAPFAVPRLADDDTSVAHLLITEAGSGPLPELTDWLVVGEGVHDARILLGEQTRVGDLGFARPGIADSGEVVAYAADRGDGPAVYVVVRDGDGLADWTEPVRVAGGPPSDELGTGPDGQPRYLADVPGSRNRVGVVHVPAGPDGIDGDRVLLAFQGTPNAESTDFSDQLGLWTVAMDVVRTGDGGITIDVERPEPVVQVGDVLAGAQVTALSLSDPLARPFDATGDDHQLAFAARTADGDVVARATWRGDDDLVAAAAAAAAAAADDAWAEAAATHADTSAVAASPAGRPAGARGPTASSPASAVGTPSFLGLVTADLVTADPSGDAASDPTIDAFVAAHADAAADDGEVFDGPHLTALTVHDDTPPRNAPLTVVNRTRGFDARPAEAILDVRNVEGTVRRLGPDEATELVPDQLGSYRVRVAAPIAPDALLLDVVVNVRAGAYAPPVLTTDGPWSIPLGAGVSFRATVDDPDGYATGLPQWDLDGDGEHGDRSGSTVNLTPQQVRDLVCGGPCEEGDYPISVELTDREGNVTRATSTLTVDGTMTFTMDAQPELLQINPGSHGHVLVAIEGTEGFRERVEVTVEGLPDGWSAWNGVVSDGNGHASLRISVPTGEADDLFDLEVVARAGDVERRAPVRVSTPFGLIPVCTADVTGTVVSAADGQPLPTARVNFGRGNVRVDDDGAYAIAYELPAGYQAFTAYRSVTADDHHASTSVPVALVCGEEVVHDVELEPVLTSEVEGRTVVGRPNPLTTNQPLPSDEPLEDVQVRVSTGTQILNVRSDDDGRFQVDGRLRQTTPGEPTRVTLQAQRDGYWSVNRVAFAEPDGTLDVGDLPLLEQCTGTVGGGRVVDQDLEPVVGATVRFPDGGWVTTETDDEGRFHFGHDGMLLGTYNAPRSVTVTALAPDGWPSAQTSGGAWIGRCGATSADLVLRLIRPEPAEPNFADAHGTVTDADTGAPLADQDVRLQYLSGSRWINFRLTQTDADGGFRFEEVPLGTGADASLAVRAHVDADGYWEGHQAGLLLPDADEQLDVAVTPIRYGSLSGVLRDLESGDPLPQTEVLLRAQGANTSDRHVTDDEGRFHFDDLQLNPENEPRTQTLSSSIYDQDRNRYLWWPNSVQVVAEADVHLEQDLELLEACPGGTIRGLVVDANTLEPLEGVEVRAGDRVAHTNAVGRYEIADVRTGDDNASNAVTIRATLAGYHDATTTVTVFCGAELEVDFGTPPGGTGTIVGTVTDLAGDPVADAFVGSSYGVVTTTDDEGRYRLEHAPLQSDGSPRDWVVTVRGNGDEASATVTVLADDEVVRDFVLGAGNTPPTAADVAVTTPAGTPVSVVLEGEDPDGDELTYLVVDEPADGTLSGDAPTLTYTPDDGFVGTDTFTYRVEDGRATSALATVTITVEARPNTPPELVAPDEVVVTAGEQVDAQVLGSDAEDDPLTLTAAGLPPYASFADAGDGVGTLTLAPPADAVAATTTVTITVSDGIDEVSAEIVVRVLEAPTGEPPTAVLPASITAFEGGWLELDGSASSASDGGELTHTWEFLGEQHDGEVVRIPAWDAVTDTVTLTVTDGQGRTHTTEADVQIVNVPPWVTVSAVTTGAADDPSARRAVGADDPVGEVTVATGEAFTVVVDVADPGVRDTHTATVDRGDGTPVPITVHDGPSEHAGPVPDAVVPDHGADPVRRHVLASARFDEPGDRSVAVEVCDDDGGCGQVQVAVTVTGAPVPPAPEPDPPAPDLDGGDDPASEPQPGPTPAPGPEPRPDEVVASPVPVAPDPRARPEARATSSLPVTGQPLGALLTVALLALGLGAGLLRRGRHHAAR